MLLTGTPTMNVMFRGKPINELSHEEAIEALKQALQHIATIEGKGQIEYVSRVSGQPMMVGVGAYEVFRSPSPEC